MQEIFQIDQPDLDFGIYRILNSRQNEIQQFLTHTLPNKIQTAFNGNFEQANNVYNHLYTFFSRYYDQGDFISQRRYKGDTYAIPYAGEEVILHWANKDQYYTKSGENFSNYAFTLENGKKVQFRLVEADTAKDNRKDNDQIRVFALLEPKIKTETDENGDEIQTDILPIEENGDVLTIRFEYKAVNKKEKQADYITQAVEKIQKIAISDEFKGIFDPMPTEKNKNRTLLEKYLTDYTTKNTADYFIHKNLGKFLNQELDFYIKNEVMNLDNIQDNTDFSHIEQNLQIIKTLKTVAKDIIAFLAQLEDFQKKLWLKKKFVAGCHYLITLDHLNKAQIQAALNNPKQTAQWKTLFNVETSGLNTAEICKNYPHLVVDTSLFEPKFQAEVLNELHDLDEKTNGLLIHSDNFQALNLLQERYKEQVKCIYIDPPYNTGNDGFLYKDRYQHSSWLSLMNDRIEKSYSLMNNSSALFCQISDLENTNLNKLMLSIFGEENHKETISVVTSSKSGVNAINVKRGERLFKIKEYVHFYSKDPSFRFNSFYTADAYNTNYKWEIYQKDDGSWFVCDLKSSKKLDDKQLEEYALKNAEHIYSIEKNNSKAGEGMKAVLEYSKTSSNVESFTDQFGITKLIYDGGVCVPLAERVIQENGKNVFGVLGSDIWDDIGQAAKSEGGVSFDNGKKPEKLLKRIIEMSTQPNEFVLDFFSGSGTTVSVAQKLGRKWIGVEQGEYFNDVLVTRIQKTLFGEQNGISKSINYNGGGIVKVLKLESYEDTLNNLELKQPASDLFAQNETLRNDYLLHYMLDVESRDSLLNTQHFTKPFDYQLNIATTSAGAYEAKTIDLVETFNYLIGLRVSEINDKRENGLVTVQGTNASGEKTLVIWRDCEKYDYDKLNRYLDSRDINPQDSEFDVVYINGDHNVPTVFADSDESVKTLKVRSIEAEFLSRMFGE
ncbi:site-specific DNA-methyltransferase [Mannheimia haemolytica]|uniref:site-specific DNA-methyltransferase n=1 Tax=Mannheimia haemolytica TaxID=75985 RepID=UPI00058A37ED|nr:site-specific DNA-methyltransferase [Mannheimia haemolytica]AJE07559.2 site-specific DNA-methyltransferase [Mannheimia haemolytica USDA-ARS-USMARC-184]UQX64055.1 site-specific DNA-methyltransferase [Mannheimia haemolytica]